LDVSDAAACFFVSSLAHWQFFRPHRRVLTVSEPAMEIPHSPSLRMRAWILCSRTFLDVCFLAFISKAYTYAQDMQAQNDIAKKKKGVFSRSKGQQAENQVDLVRRKT